MEALVCVCPSKRGLGPGGPAEIVFSPQRRAHFCMTAKRACFHATAQHLYAKRSIFVLICKNWSLRSMLPRLAWSGLPGLARVGWLAGLSGCAGSLCWLPPRAGWRVWLACWSAWPVWLVSLAWFWWLCWGGLADWAGCGGWLAGLGGLPGSLGRLGGLAVGAGRSVWLAWLARLAGLCLEVFLFSGVFIFVSLELAFLFFFFCSLSFFMCARCSWEISWVSQLQV